jgi:hypothetical protein
MMSADYVLRISRGFSAGNYAGAYISEDLDTAMEREELHWELKNEAFRHAFILGFFSSYELHEVPGSYREQYDEAYWSDHGAAVRRAGYIDSRHDDYENEDHGEWWEGDACGPCGRSGG